MNGSTRNTGLEAQRNLRVAAMVSHGELTDLGVAHLEVLVGELLTVDGLATGTLL